MNCPACGVDVAEDANFCRRCGQRLSAEAPPAGRGPDEGASATRSDRDDVTATMTPGQDVAATADEEPTGEMAVERPTAVQAEDTRIVSADEGGGDLRACPNCSASNSSRRALCGRCGADLESGEVPEPPAGFTPGPTPEGAREGAPAGTTGRTRTRQKSGNTTRTVVLVIGLGILIGALVGATIALGIGPFATGDDGIPDPPDFDAEAYDSDPGSLGVNAIGATSTHPPLGDQSFAAPQMVDGELATAWNNDGTQNPGGVGEVIAVEFGTPVWLTDIVVVNGAQQSDQDFLGNGRVARARVTLDGEQVFEVSLLDQVGRQVVSLDEPRLTTGLRIDVLEVFEGDTYEELAITEIDFRGHVAIGEDREIGLERAGGATGTEPADTGT